MSAIDLFGEQLAAMKDECDSQSSLFDTEPVGRKPR